jgi:hypothetical protein
MNSPSFPLRIAGGVATAVALLGIAAGTARAQSNGAVISVGPSVQSTAAQTLAYWTPERLRSAQPKILTTTRTFTASAGVAQPTGPTIVVPGAPPSVPYNASLAEQLYLPNTQSGVNTAAVGSTGPRYPYTIARLYPCALMGTLCSSSNLFSNVFAFYPNTIVGQLFFTEPSGNFVCSASVIRLSVIATAGHCVSGGHSDFFKNWLFIPAEFAGTAPFGRWTATQVFVTGPWFTGGGGVPNKQDDALIVLAPNSVGQRIGQLTGNLGYEFNAPLPTHLTQLGYPCNQDSCADPISDNSQAFSGPTNNFEWGSAAFGGASGGPVIQDFGQQPSHASGTPPTEAFGGNILIASFSYFYTNTNIQVDGGSILAAPNQFGGTLNTIGDLIVAVCATKGNC